MQVTLTPPPVIATKTVCHHCGEECDGCISEGEKSFCCEGCRQVFLLLDSHGMCRYYDLEASPGIRARGRFTDGRFGYLDDPAIQQKLIRFSDGRQMHLSFRIPNMHCVSCIWLLENLHQIRAGILSSRTDFHRKEIYVSVDPSQISVRGLVELLAFIGYEPYISLEDADVRKPSSHRHMHMYKIGVAGFCFGNIMMLSFPEYFSDGNIDDEKLKAVFSYLNLALSLPVLFFSASGFFISAWKGLRQRWLNIDAPIALAILVAFVRSLYEIWTGIGPGFLDSMSGIVFFMLIGRWFQDLTHDSLSFDKDYRSYFPLGVTLLRSGQEYHVSINHLQKSDCIRVRHRELVPADSILLSEEAEIDYSFVSGENRPVSIRRGEMIYAGGRPSGPSIDLEVVTPVTGSRITQLWNNEVFKHEKNREKSFIHPWSRYFTYGLFSITFFAGLYWYAQDSSRLWPVVTSILIVACPCSLLLSATFTNGHLVRIFGQNQMYLKNASVVEAIERIDTIVFDKTGTITSGAAASLMYYGTELSLLQRAQVYAVARHSIHPLSRMLAEDLGRKNAYPLKVDQYSETEGSGLEGIANGARIRLGSKRFVGTTNSGFPYGEPDGSAIHLSIQGQYMGYFSVQNNFRNGLSELAKELRVSGYSMHLLSGDNDSERDQLRSVFGKDFHMLFGQSPQDKLDYVKGLQLMGHRVLMIGDGLNDAGALRQSDVGVAVTDDAAVFTPASDAILSGQKVSHLNRFLSFARSGKQIVAASFGLSLLYNIVGLSFAIQGSLSPLIAAVLMPASTISIILFVALSAVFQARRFGLRS